MNVTPRFRFRDARGFRLSITRHQHRTCCMTREDIAARARKFIGEHLDQKTEKVTEAADLVDDLRADSLDHVELIMAAEEEFDIQITDAEAEDVKTVGQAIDLICRKLEVPA